MKIIVVPFVSALLLGFVLGWFRLGDANADTRRRPPWSATIALVALAIWLALNAMLGQPFMDSLPLTGLLLTLIAVGLAIHHASPQKRGRAFADDPSAFPAAAAFVVAAFATIHLNERFEVPVACAWVASVFAQAQFSLFIYRKYRPLT